MNRPNLRGTRVSGGSQGMALALAGLAVVWLTGCGEGGGLVSFGTGDDTQAMASYETQLKEEAQAREADPGLEAFGIASGCDPSEYR